MSASALIASSPTPMISLRRPSYPLPPPPTYNPPTPPTTPPTPTLASTQDDENGMPAPNPTRQSLSSCGAMVRYTPRRRNALVPLPLLPPIPPHVVVKRIAGVVKILAASYVALPEFAKDVEMSPAPVPTPLAHKVQFPVVQPAAAAAAAAETEAAPEQASPPLRPRLRKDSLSITPRFSLPIPSDTIPTQTTQPTTTPRPIPSPPFPVRPLNFNNLSANRKPTYEPIVFAPVQWSRPRVSSHLNPASSPPQLDSPSSAIPPHIAGLLSTPSSLPTRALLHPGYFLRARPRPATAILTPYGGWTLKATLARGGKSDELRRCALMTSESGRKLAWMGGDVRGAVEVWEAEQALEGMEDEEMELDEEMEDITQVYVQPCDENDDDDEVVCTGERKAEEKQCAVICCPFEFEGPTTCTELDVDMDCDDMDTQVDSIQQTQKLTNAPATQGRTWSDVFEVEDDEDEQQC